MRALVRCLGIVILHAFFVHGDSVCVCLCVRACVRVRVCVSGCAGVWAGVCLCACVGVWVFGVYPSLRLHFLLQYDGFVLWSSIIFIQISLV